MIKLLGKNNDLRTEEEATLFAISDIVVDF